MLIDLGNQPPSNAYLSADELDGSENTFPLKAYICDRCWLVQLPGHADASALFTQSYAYFSSVSQSWLDHARLFVETMVEKYELSQDSMVVEVASNDGYLLQYVKEQGIQCLGIEPTQSTAEAARGRGIETWQEFFGEELAHRIVAERGAADLLVANNVLAHVPDINDFTAGIALALAPNGVATLEFPHLLNLIRGLQFDTIYHEHYSYLSLTTVSRVFERAGLKIIDVEELATHGGSLRVYASRADGASETKTSVAALLERERLAGMCSLDFYADFQPAAERIKNALLGFLLQQKAQGSSVAGYGAAAKGSTLLNFAGVQPDLLPFVCDAAPSKQGMFMPGSKIPIKAPEALLQTQPNYVLILPWNIKDEIMADHGYLREQGARFVVAVPVLEFL